MGTSCYAFMFFCLMNHSGMRATLDNYNKIKRGMHLVEVVQIIGWPGDYRTKRFMYAQVVQLFPYRCYAWKTDSCAIEVYVNTQGFVMIADYWKPFRKQDPKKGAQPKKEQSKH